MSDSVAIILQENRENVATFVMAVVASEDNLKVKPNSPIILIKVYILSWSFSDSRFLCNYAFVASGKFIRKNQLSPRDSLYFYDLTIYKWLICDAKKY